VYFNQNKSAALRDTAARNALDAALDRQALVDRVLHGYGIPTTSPIPPGFTLNSQEAASTSPSGLDAAVQLLQNGGWERNENGVWQKEIDDETVTLAITLSTANTPIFDQTAAYLAEAWQALGAEVQVSQFEQTDLVQSLIRPRDFEALLYGADIGRQVDLYPFWHSSQKNDPGLNIAQYTNIDVDAHLAKARMMQDRNTVASELAEAERIITQEKPAIFLFVPTFGYVLDHDVNAAPFARISKQSERFANISQWHIRSNKLWPIFSNN